MQSFFPRAVLDEIWDLIESISEGFPTYSYLYRQSCIATVRDHLKLHIFFHRKVELPQPMYPCKHLAGKLRFPHPYQANKFIMCDKTGKEYVVICPPGEVTFCWFIGVERRGGGCRGPAPPIILKGGGQHTFCPPPPPPNNPPTLSFNFYVKQ